MMGDGGESGGDAFSEIVYLRELDRNGLYQ